MNDHTALLKACIDNPGEDTPRLMLADWYQEQGTQAATDFAGTLRKKGYWEIMAGRLSWMENDGFNGVHLGAWDDVAGEIRGFLRRPHCWCCDYGPGAVSKKEYNVFLTIEPATQELDNRVVWEWMCRRCYDMQCEGV